MKIVKQKAELLNKQDYETVVRLVESAGRTCYQSKTSDTLEGAEKFIRNIIKSGHESVIEHLSITVKFITNRNITHQIVRHRLASYSQMSTRYVNQSKDGDIEVINPFDNQTSTEFNIFKDAMEVTEGLYEQLIERGVHKDIARDVLTGAIKTELVMTSNAREWRHFFKVRLDKHAHPQIVELAKIALVELYDAYPVFFADLYEEFIGDIN